MLIFVSFFSHLLLRDVDGFVQDDPYRALPAPGMSGGPLVRHVLLGVGQQRSQRDVADRGGRTCRGGKFRECE